MKQFVQLALLVLLPFSAGMPAQAALFKVANPAQLQVALTIAQANNQDDWIALAPGTYTITTSLQYATSNDGSLSIEASPGQVLMDGQGTRQILSIQTDTDDNSDDQGQVVRISGINFHNGQGGLSITTSGAAIQVLDCVFTDNRAASGAGAKIHSDFSEITFDRCRFENNQIINIGNAGGALFVVTQTGHLNITSTRFSQNLSDLGGGAIYAIATGDGFFKISDSQFIDNIASTTPYGGNVLGGAIWIDAGVGARPALELTGNTFLGNRATAPTGTGYGGAAILKGHSISLANNIFLDNQGTMGTALYASFSSDNAEITLVNNTFSGNSPSRSGVINPGTAVIEQQYRNAISDLVANNIFAPGSVAQQLHINNNNSSVVRLLNNLFDPGVHIAIPQQPELLYISDTTHYSPSGNILAADARLSGNGHLRTASPAIDTGICGEQPGLYYSRIAPYADIDGDKRPGQGKLFGCDIGADEYKKFPWPMFLPAIIHPR